MLVLLFIGFLGNSLSGESRERVTLWSGVLGADATEWRVQGESHPRRFSKAGLGPTTTKAQRVVIVGYNKGKALFVSPRHFQRLWTSPTLDFVNQISVDVPMDKATIHLELFAKLLRPIITTHIVREKNNSLANQFSHHAVSEVVAFTNRQPVNGRFGKCA